MSDDWKVKFLVGSVWLGDDGNQWQVLFYTRDTFYAVIIRTGCTGDWFDRFGNSDIRRSPIRLVKHVGDMVLQPVGTALVPLCESASEFLTKRGYRPAVIGRIEVGDEQLCRVSGNQWDIINSTYRTDYGMKVEPIEPPPKPDTMTEAREAAERIKAGAILTHADAVLLADAVLAMTAASTATKGRPDAS